MRVTMSEVDSALGRDALLPCSVYQFGVAMFIVRIRTEAGPVKDSRFKRHREGLDYGELLLGILRLADIQ